MNGLETPIVAALGRALLHFLWEGALIAALLGVMLVALRRASAQARYLAACAAMLVIIASFAVTAIGAGPAGGPLPLPAAAWALPQADAAAGAAAVGARWPNWQSWAVALWLTGVAVLLVRRAGGWLAARRMLARATVAADDAWMARIEVLRARMGIERAVALVESALAGAPSVVGALRPVILLPAGWLMGLPAEQAETVLLHELAHVRRHDYLVNLMQAIVEDLLFYHPAVWWVGGVMRRERENCCDDAVVALGGDRREYARTLASLEGLRAGDPVLAATGGSLADRIRRLVRPAAAPRASAVPLVLAMVLVCAGAAALPAWQPQTAAQARPQTPYEKWLKEDVVYIIEDREREAFTRLTSDAEREHFIEQFWLRRDPTPGTPANEFKEEHYRRIAYANQHFAAGVPGWKTDMGRIYIQYGPPDEKETHPAAGSRPPYEQWRYKAIKGIGEYVIVEFVDAQGDGHYRMTSDPAGAAPRPAGGEPRPAPPRKGGGGDGH